MKKFIVIIILSLVGFSIFAQNLGSGETGKKDFVGELQSFFGKDFAKKVTYLSESVPRSLEYYPASNDLIASFGYNTEGKSNGKYKFTYDYADNNSEATIFSLWIKGEPYQNFAICYDNRVFYGASGEKVTYSKISRNSEMQVEFPMEDYVKVLRIIENPWQGKPVSIVSVGRIVPRSYKDMKEYVISLYDGLYMYPIAISFELKDGAIETYYLFFNSNKNKHILVDAMFVKTKRDQAISSK